MSEDKIDDDNNSKVDIRTRETTRYLKIVFISWIFIKLRGLIFNKFFTNLFGNQFGEQQGKEKFGQFNYLLQTGRFAADTATLGMTGTVFRFTVIYSEEANRKKIANLMTTSLIAVSGLAIPVFMITILLNLDAIFNIAVIPLITISLLGLYSYFLILQNLLNGYIQAERRSISYMFMNTGMFYVNLILGIIFVLVINIEVTILFSAFVATQFIFISIFALKFLRDNGFGRFSIKEFIKIAKYTGPFILVSPVLSFFNYLQYFLLIFYVGEEAIALIAIVISVAGFLNIIVDPISSSIGSLQFSLFDTNEHEKLRKLINRVSRFYVAILIPPILFLWANASFFIELLSNSSYITDETLILVLILGLGYFFRIMLHLSGQGHYFYKKTKGISTLYLLAALISIVMSFVFIQYFGIIGMGLSLLLLDILNFIFVFPFSQRLFPIKYSYKKLLLISIPTGIIIALILFVQQLQRLSYLESFIFSIIWGLIYLILIYALRIVNITETKELFKILRNK